MHRMSVTGVRCGCWLIWIQKSPSSFPTVFWSVTGKTMRRLRIDSGRVQSLIQRGALVVQLLFASAVPRGRDESSVSILPVRLLNREAQPHSSSGATRRPKRQVRTAGEHFKDRPDDARRNPMSHDRPRASAVRHCRPNGNRWCRVSIRRSRQRCVRVANKR